MAKFPLFKLNNADSPKGQLIVEAIIAITFLIIGVLTFFGLLAQSMGYYRIISDQYTATYLAAEGIEVAKNIIDSNYLQKLPWNQGVMAGDYEVDYKTTSLSQLNQNRYLRIDGNGVYDYDINGRLSPFKRVVSVATPSAGEIVVNSTVTWGERGVTYKVNLEDHFFDWRTP